MGVWDDRGMWCLKVWGVGCLEGVGGVLGSGMFGDRGRGLECLDRVEGLASMVFGG